MRKQGICLSEGLLQLLLRTGRYEMMMYGYLCCCNCAASNLKVHMATDEIQIGRNFNICWFAYIYVLQAILGTSLTNVNEI
ncbi:MAG: hypothetical protein ACOVP7_10390 [Lacibacter sp.]